MGTGGQIPALSSQTLSPSETAMLGPGIYRQQKWDFFQTITVRYAPPPGKNDSSLIFVAHIRHWRNSNDRLVRQNKGEYTLKHQTYQSYSWIIFGRSIHEAFRSQWNVPMNIFDIVNLTLTKLDLHFLPFDFHAKIQFHMSACSAKRVVTHRRTDRRTDIRCQNYYNWDWMSYSTNYMHM